jgi:predicted amidohydrolase YtcJ
VACVIDAYEAGQGRVAWPDPRHRIEHFFCPPRDGFARMQRLGALIVMQPSFLTRMRRSIEQAFGPRRHDKYPGRSALAAGVHYVASSDAPTGLTSPWAGMADAVDRGLPDGEPIGPNEALTPREAVAAYIHGGAYAMKQEGWRGVLAPGMAADLIVPDRDPLADSAPDLRGVNVLMTMVRGVIHHDVAFSRAGRSIATPAGR